MQQSFALRAARYVVPTFMLLLGMDANASTPDVIYRTSLDGSERVQIVDGLRLINDIVIVPERRELYWADTGLSDTLRRSTLNGGLVTTVVEQGILPRRGNAQALAIDPEAETLYWSEDGSPGSFSILRSDLDGGNAVAMVVERLD